MTCFGSWLGTGLFDDGSNWDFVKQWIAYRHPDAEEENLSRDVSTFCEEVRSRLRRTRYLGRVRF